MVRQSSKPRPDSVKLIALLDGRLVGQVVQATSGQLQFVYEDRWRSDPEAYPLSLSMPLAAREHKHRAINAFLWGLLPDNARTLDQYARRFGVSSGNPVALLRHIGADCAGAAQFVPPETADALRGESPDKPNVEWISTADVAAELRSVREQGIPGVGRSPRGQFSLAGAQPKIALFEAGGRWGRPAGRTPTNRILKPPSKEFPGFAENEHFCLDLAAELGLGVVVSRVMQFESESAIVVNRFDRFERNRRYYRVHQEDVCQALAILPTTKYENEGGPGLAAIVSLLRESSQEPASDVERLLDAAILNWVLVGTDAHAKNYALLHGPRGAVRLAPFYDIASVLPYHDRRLYRVRLAMAIGGEYLVRQIARRNWERLALANGSSVAYVLGRVERLLKLMPDATERARYRALDDGLNASVINPLVTGILGRIVACVAVL